VAAQVSPRSVSLHHFEILNECLLFFSFSFNKMKKKARSPFDTIKKWLQQPENINIDIILLLKERKKKIKQENMARSRVLYIMCVVLNWKMFVCLLLRLCFPHYSSCFLISSVLCIV
jgi:hypothetical protein